MTDVDRASAKEDLFYRCYMTMGYKMIRKNIESSTMPRSRIHVLREPKWNEKNLLVSRRETRNILFELHNVHYSTYCDTHTQYIRIVSMFYVIIFFFFIQKENIRIEKEKTRERYIKQHEQNK